MGSKLRTHDADAVIHRLAAAQHRVVARQQMLDEGVGAEAVKHRLKLGRLRSLYRGVYIVGPGKATRQGRWMAAVLACGAGAVLSHKSAAALWNLSRAQGPSVDVTAARKLAGRDGITTHVARLPFDEVTTHAGIPTTTVPRTLADLAGTTTFREFQRALEQAEILGLTDPLSLGDILHRDPRRRGARAIRHALEELSPQITKEELERRFREFIRDRDIPRPVTNRPIDVPGRTYEVDCVWEDARLSVELDVLERDLRTLLLP
jgi:hypothetical protein